MRPPSIPFRTSVAVLAVLLGFVLAGCGGGSEGLNVPPVSGEACIGVPAQVCRQFIADARTETVNGRPLVGVRIACEKTCTIENGEASVIKTFAGGQTVQGMVGWASPVGTPPSASGGSPALEPAPLPMAPTCDGVPADWCLEFAVGLLSQPHTQAALTSLESTCAGTCTVSAGRGYSEATFADGTSLREDWVYGSE